MSGNGNNKYPDLRVPKEDLPQGFVELQPIKGLSKLPPMINWGEDFKKMPVERQLLYAQKLASSMNQAADLIQKERNELLEVARRQDDQIKAYQQRIKSLDQIFQQKLVEENAQQQELNLRIVELVRENNQMKVKMKEAGIAADG